MPNHSVRVAVAQRNAAKCRVRKARLSQKFERDRLIQNDVERAINLAHPALAEKPE
jgi:hypothetical protein